jgi:hypothetical protein
MLSYARLLVTTLSLQACVPRYHAPEPGIDRTSLVLDAPSPLICLAGKYYHVAVLDGPSVQVPTGHPIGVRAQMRDTSGATLCSPGVSFIPKNGLTYRVKFDFNYENRFCWLGVYQRSGGGTEQPEPALRRLIHFDDYQCDAHGEAFPDLPTMPAPLLPLTEP